MKNRKVIAIAFVLVATVLGIIFFLDINFPVGLEPYFKKSYYSQFGALIISIELLTAGIYLYTKHSKTNFALALFGFTALLDPLFSLAGTFSSNVPLYATIIFALLGLLSVWIAFTNTFETGRISVLAAFGSFLLGIAVELFFNGFF